MLLLVNISLLIFISTGSPCFNPAYWIEFTLYFASLGSGVLYQYMESSFGTVAVAVDGTKLL